MAVVNTKSGLLTNADATPPVFNAPGAGKGAVFTSVGTLETLDTDSDNSVYRFVRLPSDAVIHSIKLYNDALDSGGSEAIVADLGVYQISAAGGAVLDRDCLATLITTLRAANTTGVELRFEVLDIAGIGTPLWSLAGLTADPVIEYDICLTIETVATVPAAGTITMVVLWSD